MSVFNTLYTGEDRHRIATRSPISVYIPTFDSQQYVSDYTGNYWPYRSLSLTKVLEDNNYKKTKRTMKRTLSLRLVDNRHPGSNFPQDLYQTAKRVHADQVLPIVHTGSSREAVSFPVDTFRSYNFKLPASLIIPVPSPYELTSATLRESIYRQQGSAGMDEPLHPTHACIRGLSHETSYSRLVDAIETVSNAVSNDVKLHLHRAPLSGSLVRFIRHHPNIISSVTISPNDPSLIQSNQERPTLEKDVFSDTGKEDLREPLSPYVRVATEFSFLCSSFLQDTKVRQALLESVIPEEDESGLPLTGTQTQNQTTLTNLHSKN
jgi:hypothetical protein